MQQLNERFFVGSNIKFTHFKIKQTYRHNKEKDIENLLKKTHCFVLCNTFIFFTRIYYQKIQIFSINISNLRNKSLEIVLSLSNSNINTNCNTLDREKR